MNPMPTYADTHTSISIAKLLISVMTCFIFAGCAEAELAQADLGDINKLMQQRASASKAQRIDANEFIKSAAEAIKQQRWDLASKMYGTSAQLYPSFAALKSLGEAKARSDRRRDTLKEALAAQHAAFKSAADSLRTAVLLAEKLPSEATPEQLASVQAQIACIDAYDGGTVANCEPVASVIKRYVGSKKTDK